MMHTFQHSSVFCSSSQARTTWLRGDILLLVHMFFFFLFFFYFIFFVRELKWCVRTPNPMSFFFFPWASHELDWARQPRMSRSTRHVNGGGGAVAFQHTQPAALPPPPPPSPESCRKPEPFHRHSARWQGKKRRRAQASCGLLKCSRCHVFLECEREKKHLRPLAVSIYVWQNKRKTLECVFFFFFKGRNNERGTKIHKYDDKTLHF